VKQFALTLLPLRHFFAVISSDVCAFFMPLRPNTDHGLLINKVSRSHTTTHHSQ